MAAGSSACNSLIGFPEVTDYADAETFDAQVQACRGIRRMDSRGGIGGIVAGNRIEYQCAVSAVRAMGPQ